MADLDLDLARSACRVFGHRWGGVNYRAVRTIDPLHMRRTLKIERQRVCSRCGKVEVAER